MRLCVCGVCVSVHLFLLPKAPFPSLDLEQCASVRERDRAALETAPPTHTYTHTHTRTHTHTHTYPASFNPLKKQLSGTPASKHHKPKHEYDSILSLSKCSITARLLNVFVLVQTHIFHRQGPLPMNNKCPTMPEVTSTLHSPQLSQPTPSLGKCLSQLGRWDG